MKIFVLTIHNPNYSFGPHARLQSFLNIPKDENIEFQLPNFSKTHTKGKTLDVLIQSLGYLLSHRRKIDLIHVVTPPSFVGLIAVLAKKILKIPYIVDVGDPSAENLLIMRGWKENSQSFKVAKAIDNTVYKNASHLVLTSPLLNKYVPTNIPQTTLLTATKPKDKFITPNLQTNKKCVYLGNYGPLQKIEYILEVFEEAIKRDPSISLDIIGTGQIHKELQETLPKNIRVLPAIPAKEIPKTIKNYSLGIVSLTLEKTLDYAVPTKVLTYLSEGLPVFGPGGAAIKEIVKSAQAGQISTEYNAKKDARHLSDLLNSSNQLKNHSKNAVQYAKKHLSEENFGRKASTIYKSSKN